MALPTIARRASGRNKLVNISTVRCGVRTWANVVHLELNEVTLYHITRKKQGQHSILYLHSCHGTAHIVCAFVCEWDHLTMPAVHIDARMTIYRRYKWHKEVQAASLSSFGKHPKIRLRTHQGTYIPWQKYLLALALWMQVVKIPLELLRQRWAMRIHTRSDPYTLTRRTPGYASGHRRKREMVPLHIHMGQQGIYIGHCRIWSRRWSQGNATEFDGRTTGTTEDIRVSKGEATSRPGTSVSWRCTSYTFAVTSFQCRSKTRAWKEVYLDRHTAREWDQGSVTFVPVYLFSHTRSNLDIACRAGISSRRRQRPRYWLLRRSRCCCCLPKRPTKYPQDQRSNGKIKHRYYITF